MHARSSYKPNPTEMPAISLINPLTNFESVRTITENGEIFRSNVDIFSQKVYWDNQKTLNSTTLKQYYLFVLCTGMLVRLLKI